MSAKLSLKGNQSKQMSQEAEKTIVAVDDDPTMLKALELAIQARGYNCLTFVSPVRALKHILRWPPDAVITDFDMPDMTGLVLVEEIQARLGSNAPPCLIVSANPDEELISTALMSGVTDYLCKPVAAGELNVKLRRALATRRTSAPGIESNQPLTQIGEYKIVRELGRGGMGVVYAVQHPDHKELLALKTLATEVTDVEAMLRFRREIDVLTGLDHPGLVRFYGAGRHKNLSYYTMDLVEGESLRERMILAGGLSFQELAPIVYVVASALSYLHRHELIHRDVKPGNILVQVKGRTVLTDFGLAKHVYDSQLTSKDDLLGTPNYMSPETILGESIDGRSDLFSLGMVALGALMGQTPIDFDNPYATMRAIMGHEYPSALNFEVPEAFGRAIDRLLETKPEDRTQSGAEVMADLEPYVSAKIKALVRDWN